MYIAKLVTITRTLKEYCMHGIISIAVSAPVTAPVTAIKQHQHQPHSFPY